MDSAEPHVSVPQLRLDELLTQLQNQLESVRMVTGRVNSLLDAVVAVNSSLELGPCCGESLRPRRR